MVFQRHRLDHGLQHLLLEDLDVLRVTLPRMQHLVLFLHHLTGVQERAQVELRVRVVSLVVVGSFNIDIVYIKDSLAWFLA